MNLLESYGVVFIYLLFIYLFIYLPYQSLSKALKPQRVHAMEYWVTEISSTPSTLIPENRPDGGTRE